MPMTHRQIPRDGVGREQTLTGSGIRLKGKNLQTARSTTLKITGMSSGAVKYVNILVKTGTPARFTNPIQSPEIPPEEERYERQREVRREERTPERREERTPERREERDTRRRETTRRTR
tara:strand:+ start:91 stop:450 length:360 start_codon:yes stop_codon:yes gene_type:complete